MLAAPWNNMGKEWRFAYRIYTTGFMGAHTGRSRHGSLHSETRWPAKAVGNWLCWVPATPTATIEIVKIDFGRTDAIAVYYAKPISQDGKPGMLSCIKL